MKRVLKAMTRLPDDDWVYSAVSQADIMVDRDGDGELDPEVTVQADEGLFFF